MAPLDLRPLEPDPFEGLAGRVTVTVTDGDLAAFTRNQVVVMAEHDLRPTVDARYGAYQVVPRSMLADAPMLAGWLNEHLARRLKPWLDPDDPWPRPLVLFPLVDRLERQVRQRRAQLRAVPWRARARIRRA